MGRKISTTQKTVLIVVLIALFAIWWKLLMRPFQNAHGLVKFVAASGVMSLSFALICWLAEIQEYSSLLFVGGIILYGLALLALIKSSCSSRSYAVDSNPTSYVNAGSCTASVRHASMDKKEEAVLVTSNLNASDIPEVPIIMASSVGADSSQRSDFNVVVVNHLLYPDWARLPSCARSLKFSKRGGSILCLNPINPWANREKIADDIAEMTGYRHNASSIGSCLYIGRVTSSAEDCLDELKEYFATLHCELVLAKSARFQGLDAEQRKDLQKFGFVSVIWPGWRKRGVCRCGFCLHEWASSICEPGECPRCKMEDWKSGIVLRCVLCLHEWNYSAAGAVECPICGTPHPSMEPS